MDCFLSILSVWFLFFFFHFPIACDINIQSCNQIFRWWCFVKCLSQHLSSDEWCRTVQLGWRKPLLTCQEIKFLASPIHRVLSLVRDWPSVCHITDHCFSLSFLCGLYVAEVQRIGHTSQGTPHRCRKSSHSLSWHPLEQVGYFQCSHVASWLVRGYREIWEPTERVTSRSCIIYPKTWPKKKWISSFIRQELMA